MKDTIESSSVPRSIDGDAIDAWLPFVAGRPDAARSEVDALERAIGHTLPEETRRFLAAAPELPDPDVQGHPEIDGVPFAAGLPDVDAFLDALARPLLGRYLSTAHFIGAYPFAACLDRGDYMYAMAALDAHGPGVGGVLYYDEREVGTWGATCSAFLARVVTECWKAIDGQRDDLDEDELESFEPDLADLRDCFRLPAVAGLPELPPIAELSPALARSWDPFWRRRLGLRESRWWIPSFLRGRLEPYDLSAIPTPEVWSAERELVGRSYADTVYWVLTHALLGNHAELDDARERARALDGTYVRAFVDAAPSLVERHAEQRAKLYALANRRA